MASLGTRLCLLVCTSMHSLVRKHTLTLSRVLLLRSLRNGANDSPCTIVRTALLKSVIVGISTYSTCMSSPSLQARFCQCCPRLSQERLSLVTAAVNPVVFGLIVSCMCVTVQPLVDLHGYVRMCTVYFLITSDNSSGCWKIDNFHPWSWRN